MSRAGDMTTLNYGGKTVLVHGDPNGRSKAELRQDYSDLFRQARVLAENTGEYRQEARKAESAFLEVLSIAFPDIDQTRWATVDDVERFTTTTFKSLPSRINKSVSELLTEVRRKLERDEFDKMTAQEQRDYLFNKLLGAG